MGDFLKLPGLPGLLLQITGLLTESAISGIRNFVYESMKWMGEQAETISDYPVLRNTELARQLKKAGDSLKEAGSSSFEAIYSSIHRAAESLSETLLTLGIVDENLFQNLASNIADTAILGDSFVELRDPMEVRTSFRRNGSDVTPEAIAEAFREAPEEQGLMICLPGLYQDESLWKSGRPQPIADLLKQQSYFPVYLRLHPGLHVSALGQQISQLIESLLALLPDISVHFMSFSQGGLILRSTLLANDRSGGSIRKRCGRVILISSPDGGYFIEKTGLLFGFGLGEAPSRAIKFMSFAGNVHSPAFRDMAAGIIREEDEKKNTPILPLSTNHYFGELDGLDAYQIYSLISDSNHIWSNWLGDGLVEESSLTLLSDIVYRRLGDSHVHCLVGLSHFQILQSEAFQKVLFNILEKP
jgi:pimeloyl-ACP methyl ester carboxylesterase